MIKEEYIYLFHKTHDGVDIISMAFDKLENAINYMNDIVSSDEEDLKQQVGDMYFKIVSNDMCVKFSTYNCTRCGRRDFIYKIKKVKLTR
jgi:hypothetical protein